MAYIKPIYAFGNYIYILHVAFEQRDTIINEIKLLIDNTRVRDSSVKPAAPVGIVYRQSEDLQRIARAAGNAHILI